MRSYRSRSLTGFEFAMAMRDLKREREPQTVVAPLPRSPSTEAWARKVAEVAEAAEKRSLARSRIRNGA
jgi:hypothetical protein